MNDATVRIESIGVDNREAIEAVVALGNQYRDRLGLLPYAVFDEAVEQSRLFVARPEGGGPILGYALFRLPRNEVSVTHLCVREEAREHGVATALVEAVSARYQTRLGIRAKCRDDYNLARAWTALGFQPRARTTGRGRDRAPMTVWWRDHGHPDLFTEYEQPVELRAAIDLNIVRDLANPEARRHRSEFLIADDLAGRLQLVVTSGMYAEIHRSVPERRQPLLDAVSAYPTLHADSAKAASLQERIVEAVRARWPQYPCTDQDRSDLLQVTHAAAADVSVFLTWDDGLIRTLGPVVAQLTDMKIMAPEYVVLHLEELANAESFLGQSLEDSEFSRTRAGASIEAELDGFRASFAGERRRELRDRIRQLVQAGHTLEVIRAADGTAVALYAAVHDGRSWRVPLVRLADHRLADTLARHLLWSFRRQAAAAGAALLDIAEPYLSPRLVQAADFESLTHVDNHCYAPIVDVCGTSHEVAAAAKKSFDLANIGAPPLLSRGLSPHVTARLEHAWWPAKIVDSDLPCYTVPIKSAFAFELFGYPLGITPRNTQLSLGREHVYYRSAVNSVLTEPARILWLATGNGSGAGHFFAVSKLDGLMVDAPANLHAALSYYGVFNLSAVIKAARSHPAAEALRLSNTEVFDTPVSMRTFQASLERLGGSAPTFYTARRLSPELFAAVYIEGTRSGRRA